MPTYLLLKAGRVLDASRSFVAFVVTLAYLSFASSASAAVSISGTPDAALLDQRIVIQIFGLKPNAPVRVSAKSQAQDALWWRSEDVFIADDRGQIDLTLQAPLSGSYSGIDSMGA